MVAADLMHQQGLCIQTLPPFFAELETNSRVLDDERILSLLETCSDTLEHTTSCEHMLLIGRGKLWRISHVIREPVWQLCTMAGADYVI
jgi:hypothetical protein